MKLIVFISFLFCIIVCWGTDYNVIKIMFFGIIIINALEIAEKDITQGRVYQRKISLSQKVTPFFNQNIKFS